MTKNQSAGFFTIGKPKRALVFGDRLEDQNGHLVIYTDTWDVNNSHVYGVRRGVSGALVRITNPNVLVR